MGTYVAIDDLPSAAPCFSTKNEIVEEDCVELPSALELE